MTIGFKEWALVCQALEEGQTSLLVRKGGIAEGRAGFRFLHSAFVLFPTLFHEQLEKTRLPSDSTSPVVSENFVRITIRATVCWTRLITSHSVLQKLEPFHILHPDVVEDRFIYQPKPNQKPAADGVNIAFLRIEKADMPWEVPISPQFGGCRSWVELPPVPETLIWRSVLDDAEHKKREDELRIIVD